MTGSDDAPFPMITPPNVIQQRWLALHSGNRHMIEGKDLWQDLDPPPSAITYTLMYKYLVNQKHNQKLGLYHSPLDNCSKKSMGTQNGKRAI